ncbi:MAG TPA: tryptophan halogenase, partial [Myxococcota bacterium]|nr:tryptophan halogenase [Myxococcota bacterium]
ALTWDPLAGQGVIKALDDGIRAADAIVATLRGDAGALHRYADDYAARFVAYRSVRARSYAAERRWCDRPFWRRRVDRSQDPALAAPWTELAPPPGVILVS